MEVAEAESRRDSSIKVADFLLNASQSPIVAKVADLVAVNEQVQLKALTEFYDRYVFSFLFISTSTNIFLIPLCMDIWSQNSRIRWIKSRHFSSELTI